MIPKQTLKDAERIVRITMIVILLTAGTSKLFSQGAFFDFNSQLFQGELRIHLPPSLVNAFLTIVPFIEIGLGLFLISNRHRNLAVYAWFAFMLCLLFGHYVLQDWSTVNQMLDYIFLGLLCLVLPHHLSWFSRK
jgi:uncharacterized membrane protein YphA (DoxX/SURF4 family)